MLVPDRLKPNLYKLETSIVCYSLYMFKIESIGLNGYVCQGSNHYLDRTNDDLDFGPCVYVIIEGRHNHVNRKSGVLTQFKGVSNSRQPYT